MSHLLSIIATSLSIDGFNKAPAKPVTSAYFSVPLRDRVALARRANTPGGERVHVITEPPRKYRDQGYASIADVPVEEITSVLERTHGYGSEQIEFWKD